MNRVPIVWKPAFYLYGYGIGFAWWLFYRFLEITCFIKIDGKDKLEKGNHILCLWHVHYMKFFIVFRSHKRHIWMNHPYWYMKPIEVLLRLMNIKKQAFGSTGNKGKAAADEIVSYLKQGYSTAIAPDGPAGPPKVLKNGCIHMALQSQTPIIPIRFKVNRCFRLRSWDQKEVPLPFSTITVEIGDPIVPIDDEIEKFSQIISKSLDYKES